MIKMAELRESESSRTLDCAWCAELFDDFVDLLSHVESCHIDVPDPDLHAAA